MTPTAPPTPLPTRPDAESPRSAAQAPSLWARGGPWLIMLAGAILSLTLVARIPDQVFFSGDGGLKLLLARQFAAGRWACDLQLPAEPWLRQLWEKGAYPFAPPFVYPLRGGHYLAFPVTFPFVTAPFYACFGYYGLYVLPLAGLWLTWLQFHLLCKRF
jgi:hypothetical protein